jgi:hypothetical protein
MSGLSKSAYGAVWMAVVSTAGDYVWARWISAHRPAFGLVHGAVLCLTLGAYLGALRGRAARGAALGFTIGLACAAGFYVLRGALGVGAMFAMWMALWALFGVMNGPGLRPGSSVRDGLARGAIAAVSSGLAFYAISGIWTKHAPGGPDYLVNLASWTFAYLAGFLPLLLERRVAR